MAPNPKNPRQPRPPRKPNSGGGGPRRGRPRKNADEETPKRANMPLPASLLDTTISDGEEYRPGTYGGPAAEEPRSDAPERGNEAVPPPSAFVPMESRESMPPPPPAP